MFLKNFQNSLENTCAETFLLIKLQASAHNLIKKETPAQIFFCEFCKIFQHTCFYRPPPGVSERLTSKENVATNKPKRHMASHM